MKYIENISTWQIIESGIESADLSTQKNLTKEEIVNICKKISCYSYDKGFDTDIIKSQKVLDQENKGEIINSHIFYRFYRHYILKANIEGKKTEELSILMNTIHGFLGNQYYFPVKEDVIRQIVELGNNYLRQSRVFHQYKDKYLERLIESTIYLQQLGIDLCVKMGEVQYDEKIEQKCFSMLENMIASVGGGVVGAELFNQYVPQYYPLIDRLEIGRKNDQERNIPINIVLQLALKHIGNPLHWNIRKNVDMKPIMRMAEAWLDIMQIQGESSSEYGMMDLTQFPLYLNNELYFDKMCIPEQYSKKYILVIMDALIAPWFDSKADKQYSFKDYRKVSEWILSTYDHAWFSFIDVNEISKKCKVAKYKVILILKDLSIEISNLNKDFCSLDGETNYNQYPIAHFPMYGYYCMERHLCGIGFYNVACKMIMQHYPVLSRLQGDKVEQIIKDEMAKNGIEYHYGKYQKKQGIPEGQCDIVLDKSHLIFIEAKRHSANKGFDKIDDVSMLKELALGMVEAQKQAFFHEYYLKTNHEICMSDEMGNAYQLSRPQNDLEPFKISVCLPEYSFLTNKIFCMELMEILMVANFHTLDTDREIEMEKINMYADQIRNCIVGLYPNEKPVARDLAFYSLFCSLQQLLDAIWLADTEETLVDYLKWWIYSSSKNLDPYVQLMKAYLSHKDPHNFAVEKKAIDMLYRDRKTAMFLSGV